MKKFTLALGKFKLLGVSSLRGLLFTIFLVFLSMPAFGQGKVVDFNEKLFMNTNATFRTEMSFTISLKEPGPLRVEFLDCKVMSGWQSFAPIVTENKFKVLSFTLNGEPIKTVRTSLEGFPHSRFQCNALKGRQGVFKITMENPDKIFPPGSYSFSIVTLKAYIPNQIDGLEYIGNFFALWVRDHYVLENPTAEIILPEGYKILKTHQLAANPIQRFLEMGEKGREIIHAAKAERISENHYKFWPTIPLEPGVHEFQGGVFFQQPLFGLFPENPEANFLETALAGLAHRFEIGTTAVLNILLAAAILVYFIFARMLVWAFNYFPKKGMVFHPPFGLEPAQIKSIEIGHFDVRAFAATLINLGIKGSLGFSLDSRGFLLKKNPRAKALTDSEEKILSVLFKDEREALLLDPSDLQTSKLVRQTFARFTRSVAKETKRIRNRLGVWFSFIGLILSISAIGFSFYVTLWRGPNYYLLMVGYFLIVLYYGYQIYARTNIYSATRRLSAIVFWISVGVYFFWEFFGHLIYFKSSWSFFGFEFLEFGPLVLIALLNLLFFFSIGKTYPNKSYAREIWSYKNYLKETNCESLAQNLHFREDRKTFIDHFPFVIALGYEKNWGERFDGWRQKNLIRDQIILSEIKWLEIPEISETGFGEFGEIFGGMLVSDLREILIGGWAGLLFGKGWDLFWQRK